MATPSTLNPRTIGPYGYNSQGASPISQLGLIPSQTLGTSTTAQLAYNPPTTSASRPSTPDFGSVLQRAIELQRQAYAPAISSLQQNIGNIQKGFSQARSSIESQRQPLQDRYNNLIAEIKGQGEQAVQSQTRVTNAELARRGVSGGLAEQEIERATAPIRERTAASTKDVGLQGQSALAQLEGLLAGLAGQEAGSLQGVYGNIAGLQTGAVQNALQQALALTQLQEQARQFNERSAAATPAIGLEDLFAVV